MKKHVCAFLTITFLALGMSHAIDFKGVKFDDSVKVGASTLKLNGIGIRKFLVLHVYYAALYTAEPTSDAQAIINSKTPKQLIMHFKRWVEKSKILDAWEEGLSKNREEGYDFQPDFKKLKDIMGHMNENDRMILTFYADSVEVKAKDKDLKIESGNFSKALLKVFINNAPDPDLKKGLLTLPK